MPALSLGTGCLQWADRIKYLGIWLKGGKVFKVDCTVNRIKFLGSVFCIMLKCSKVSEKILWNIISKCCLPIVLYGVDSLSLHVGQVHKLSVALNLAIRHSFHMARNVSVRSLLYFVGSMPMNMMLYERKVNKLVKSCLNSSEVISLCVRMRSTYNSFLDICHKNDVHCELSNNRVSHNFTSYLYNMLKENDKL